MKPFSPVSLILFWVLFVNPVVNGFEIPDFVSQVPKGHFVGISTPFDKGNLVTARNSAIADVVKQVLGSINVKYNYSYTNRMTGNPRSPIIQIQDNLSQVAEGVVLDVERNIVRSSYLKDALGYYISFILVSYPDSKILEMRRLSKGSNIVGYVLSESSGILRIKITETNGVAVTLASADISIIKKYRFSKFINFCIWKVPYGSTDSFSIALNPIKICGGSSIVKLDFRQSKKNWKDYLLGAKLDYYINIKGFDEIGRPVQTALEY